MMKTLSSGNCTLSVPAKNSYRMVVLGASRVGKSSIVSRFLNGRFDDQYTPTIEDFHRKVYNIRGDMYQLDILDTSGNHPFPAMRRLSILTGMVSPFARRPSVNSDLKYIKAKVLREGQARERDKCTIQ
ncbi:GTP-binding protein Rhes [Puma concolor]|uniref:GTP-binding protein Rhes n=1 Tax=Puma concolor TaxID=9696 RepID=A0A6P6I2A8_PUMCO|nr:GTP-binding protein Rhes [Puma concolor]